MDKLLPRKCNRCRGTVVYDKFYGPHDQFWGWKCLICGDIIDPIILENRQLMRSGQETSGRRARVQQGER